MPAGTLAGRPPGIYRIGIKIGSSPLDYDPVTKCMGAYPTAWSPQGGMVYILNTTSYAIPGGASVTLLGEGRIESSFTFLETERVFDFWRDIRRNGTGELVYQDSVKTPWAWHTTEPRTYTDTLALSCGDCTMTITGRGRDVYRDYVPISESMITTSFSTPNEEGPTVPKPFAFSLSGENPVGAEARFTLTLDAPEHVEITLYDALGREVAVLADREFPAGTSDVALDATRLPAGTYAARARGESGSKVVRLTVVK